MNVNDTELQPRANGSRTLPAGIASRVVNLVLMEKERWFTESNDTNNNTVVGAVLKDVGGKIESVQASLYVSDLDGAENFRCEIRMQTSWDGLHWGSPVGIFAKCNGSGSPPNLPKLGLYAIDVAHTDTTNIGRYLRFLLYWWSAQDQVEAFAELSGMVSVKFLGQ